MDEIKIGKTIRELRIKRGISQEELAKELFVSSQAISKWETGKALPEASLIPIIAEYFDMTIDALFKGIKANNAVAVEVRKVLISMGISNTSVGFFYITDAVLYLIENPSPNVKTAVKVVCDKYGLTYNAVRNGICNAADKTVYHGYKKIIIECFLKTQEILL